MTTQQEMSIRARQVTFNDAIADLLKQRSIVEFRIFEIDRAIEALRKLMPREEDKQ